jgi:hypothetical protein
MLMLEKAAAGVLEKRVIAAKGSLSGVDLLEMQYTECEMGSLLASTCWPRVPLWEARSRSVAITVLRAERHKPAELFPLPVLTSYLPCVVYAHHFRCLDEVVPRIQDVVRKSSCNAKRCAMVPINSQSWIDCLAPLGIVRLQA